jgi:hypothetical protein
LANPGTTAPGLGPGPWIERGEAGRLDKRGVALIDIKELLQTYAVINDPNVKEVTTKFAVLLVGLGVAGFAAWGLVGLDEDEAQPAGPTAASNQDADLAGDRLQDCVPQEEADEWRDEHAEIFLENRMIDTEETGDWVCFTYIG